MIKTREPFLPVDTDIDDGKLERLAQAKGVGAMVRTEAASVPVAAAAVQPKPRIEPEARVGEGPTPRSRMKSVNLELPDYVWTELKIRSAREQVSVRHLIMSALKAGGTAIHEADMVEDGRRVR